MTARQQGTHGTPDDAQITHATTNGWPILTNNDRDFYRLHQGFQGEGRLHSGIIVVPQTNLPPRLDGPPAMAHRRASALRVIVPTNWRWLSAGRPCITRRESRALLV